MKFEKKEITEREHHIGMWYCAVGISIGAGIFLG